VTYLLNGCQSGAVRFDLEIDDSTAANSSALTRAASVSVESNGHTVRRRRDRPERARLALLQRRFVPRTRNMRFRNCDPDRREFAGVPAECTRTCGVG
jgi:hypothetical protein